MFSITFATDYMVQWYLSRDRLMYVLSLSAFADFITIVPQVLSIVAREHLGGFSSDADDLSQATRAARVFRALRIIRVVKLAPSLGLQRQLFFLTVAAVSIVFVAAGFYHVMESDGPGDLPFHEALYFMTAMVLGRPAASASRDASFLFLTGVIATAVVVIPIILASVVRVWVQSADRGLFTPNPHAPHILVTGDASLPRARALLAQLFHESRHSDDLPPVVFLHPDAPSGALLALFDQDAFGGRVTYVKGSPLSQGDLARAGASGAAAIMSLAPHDTSAEKADASTLATALAAKNQKPELRCLLQLRDARSRAAVFAIPGWSLHDVAVVLPNLSMTMLGVGLVVPGLPALISMMIQQGSRTAAQRAERARAAWEALVPPAMASDAAAADVSAGGGFMQRALKALQTREGTPIDHLGMLQASGTVLNDVDAAMHVAHPDAAQGGVLLRQVPWTHSIPEAPLEEFSQAFAQQLHVFDLPDGLAWRSFGAAARVAFLRHRVLLLAMRLHPQDSDLRRQGTSFSPMQLFPCRKVLDPRRVAALYALAPEQGCVDRMLLDVGPAQRAVLQQAERLRRLQEGPVAEPKENNWRAQRLAAMEQHAWLLRWAGMPAAHATAGAHAEYNLTVPWPWVRLADARIHPLPRRIARPLACGTWCAGAPARPRLLGDSVPYDIGASELCVLPPLATRRPTAKASPHAALKPSVDAPSHRSRTLLPPPLPPGLLPPMQGSQHSLKDHLLVCGASPNMALLLRALRGIPYTPSGVPSAVFSSGVVGEDSDGEASHVGGVSANGTSRTSSDAWRVVVLCPASVRESLPLLDTSRSTASRLMDSVLWVDGDPTSVEDCIAAGALTARAALVLASRSPGQAPESSALLDDVGAISVASCLFSLRPSLHVLTHLRHGSSAAFLRPAGNSLSQAASTCNSRIQRLRQNVRAMRARRRGAGGGGGGLRGRAAQRARSKMMAVVRLMRGRESASSSSDSDSETSSDSDDDGLRTPGDSASPAQAQQAMRRLSRHSAAQDSAASMGLPTAHRPSALLEDLASKLAERGPHSPTGQEGSGQGSARDAAPGPRPATPKIGMLRDMASLASLACTDSALVQKALDLKEAAEHEAAAEEEWGGSGQGDVGDVAPDSAQAVAQCSFDEDAEDEGAEREEEQGQASPTPVPVSPADALAAAHLTPSATPASQVQAGSGVFPVPGRTDRALETLGAQLLDGHSLLQATAQWQAAVEEQAHPAPGTPLPASPRLLGEGGGPSSAQDASRNVGDLLFSSAQAAQAASAQRREGEAELFGAPAFAAGRAFAASSLDALLVEAHFTPHAVSLIKRLVRASRKQRLQLVSAQEALFMARWHASSLGEVGRASPSPPPKWPVPSQQWPRVRYGQLFEALLRGWHLLTLGVYRRRSPYASSGREAADDVVLGAALPRVNEPFQHSGEMVSYVLANPPPEALLSPHDYVYVLRGHGAPALG